MNDNYPTRQTAYERTLHLVNMIRKDSKMKKYAMTVKDLKEALNRISDDTEVFIANSINICGNISALCEVKENTYGFFGKSLPCIILGSGVNTEFEED